MCACVCVRVSVSCMCVRVSVCMNVNVCVSVCAAVSGGSEYLFLAGYSATQPARTGCSTHYGSYSIYVRFI